VVALIDLVQRAMFVPVAMPVIHVVSDQPQ
jgi:hypothetical protein